MAALDKGMPDKSGNIAPIHSRICLGCRFRTDCSMLNIWPGGDLPPDGNFH
jgi:hypothetical protein